MSQELERVYTINLGKVLLSQSQHRAVRAINMIREFARHHMKVETIKIEEELARQIWARGVRSPPRKVRVRMTKTEDGYILVSQYVEEESKVTPEKETKKVEDKVEKPTTETKKVEDKVEKPTTETKKVEDKVEKPTTETKKEAPKKAKEAPKKAKPAPKKAKEAPKKAKEAPKKAKEAPKKAKEAPKKAKEAPKKAKPAPKKESKK
jgi:large subunit ribosomal protein L31e